MVVLETTCPEYLRHGECLLPALTPHPIRVEDMLGGEGYSKETQLLARKPCEKCGNRLELLQSQIKFPSSSLPARPRTCKSQREPLSASFLTLHVTSWGKGGTGRGGGGGPQVLSQEAQGGSSVPSASGKGGISF